MPLSLVTAPAQRPLHLSDVKLHLRVDDDDDDTLIDALIDAATSYLDGRYGILGRALVTQTWDLTLDRFCHPIRVPLPPLQSVTSITYLDGNGVSQTLATSVYSVDAAAQPGLIRLAYNQVWPTTRDIENAVTVRFVAGYGLTDAVPRAIRQAMLMMIGHWYESRESVNIGNIVNQIPMASDALLAPFRIHHFGG